MFSYIFGQTRRRLEDPANLKVAIQAVFSGGLTLVVYARPFLY